MILKTGCRQGFEKLFTASFVRNSCPFQTVGFANSVTVKIILSISLRVEINNRSLDLMNGNKSAIRKKMAPRAAFWVDRHIGLKFTVFVWESDGK